MDDLGGVGRRECGVASADVIGRRTPNRATTEREMGREWEGEGTRGLVKTCSAVNR
jgi:hypothetical protein